MMVDGSGATASHVQRSGRGGRVGVAGRHHDSLPRRRERDVRVVLPIRRLHGARRRWRRPPRRAEVPIRSQAASWADSQTVFLVANMGVHSELFSIDLRHPDDLKQITDGPHALDGWSYLAASSRHVFVLQEAARPGEIWTVTTGVPQRVTNVFGDLTKQFKIARQKQVSWKAPDGQRVEGLLFYPVDYVAGRKYPARRADARRPGQLRPVRLGGRLSYAEVLAGRNCFVFRPNYRGSTGYGNPFLRDMVGHYFRSSHLDVLSGVDWLVAQGLADPDRLIKMGGAPEGI